jgi:hypothetical protein
LSCLTRDRIFLRSQTGPDGAREALTMSGDGRAAPISAQGPIQLELAQQFHVWRQEDRGTWRVSTDAYQYTLADNDGRELAAWHWHPNTSPHPHTHVKRGFEGTHLPIGRVSIEAVIRMLLTDLEVQPTHAHEHDYLGVLERSDTQFIDERTWHAWQAAPSL